MHCAIKPVSPEAYWTRIASVSHQTAESHFIALKYMEAVAKFTERPTKKEEYSGNIAIYAMV